MSLLSRLSLATATLLIIGTSAYAADLPSKKAAPKTIPTPVQKMSNWTGVYGGLNAGLGFGNFTKEGKDVFGNPTGGTLGVTGGYNYQAPNNWVYGLEADLSLGNIKGSNTGSSEARYINTFRGRLGYAMNETMPYVTAGYAGATTHDSNGGSTVDNYHNGYTLGGGVEAIISGPWTAKVEALYIHLEEKDIPSSGGSSGADWGLVRVGLNYKF